MMNKIIIKISSIALSQNVIKNPSYDNFLCVLSYVLVWNISMMNIKNEAYLHKVKNILEEKHYENSLQRILSKLI